MIEGDSKVVVPVLFQAIGKVDLCFIDSDHKYESVMTDYSNCKNNTSLILLHDTCWGGEMSKRYLANIEKDGRKLLTFPTRFLEGDGHLTGITLAYK